MAASFNLHAGLADAGMHLTCKQAHAGATPAAGSTFHSPVVQSAERSTLTREVDGAIPSGASILIHAASIKVMLSALNGENGERYPGGLPCFMLL